MSFILFLAYSRHAGICRCRNGFYDELGSLDDVASRSLCQQKCDEISSCNAFSWNPSGKCRLTSSMASIGHADDWEYYPYLEWECYAKNGKS